MHIYTITLIQYLSKTTTRVTKTMAPRRDTDKQLLPDTETCWGGKYISVSTLHLIWCISCKHRVLVGLSTCIQFFSQDRIATFYMNKINNNPVGSFKVSVSFSIARLFSFSTSHTCNQKSLDCPRCLNSLVLCPKKKGLENTNTHLL